jgi:hypothetical protein
VVEEGLDENKLRIDVNGDWGLDIEVGNDELWVLENGCMRN